MRIAQARKIHHLEINVSFGIQSYHKKLLFRGSFFFVTLLQSSDDFYAEEFVFFKISLKCVTFLFVG